MKVDIENILLTVLISQTKLSEKELFEIFKISSALELKEMFYRLMQEKFLEKGIQSSFEDIEKLLVENPAILIQAATSFYKKEE